MTKDLKKALVKISVCIPVHNSESWLAESINSIIDQTFKEWEIICVDDGSTDSSPRVIAHFKKILGDQFKWACLKNSCGIAYARNLAVDLAEGEIICVQDSDDLSQKDRLKSTWRYFQRHRDTDLVYGSYQYLSTLSRPLDVVQAKPFYYEEFKRHNFISHPTVAYRAKAIRKVPYRDECKVLDDLFLYFDFYKAGMKIAHMNDILAFYRVGHNQTSTSKDKEEMIKNLRDQFAKEAA